MSKKTKSKTKISSLKKQFPQPLKMEELKNKTSDFVTSRHLKASKNIKILIGVVLIASVVVVGIFWVQIDKDKVEYATTRVERGSLIQTVNETGVIQASKRIDLNFLNTGRIDSILVKVGEKVQEGQVLAKLDYENLLIKQKEAKANLAAQVAGLERLLAGATQEEINVSESSLSQAQASYNTAKIELEEIEKSNKESIRQAKNILNNLGQKDKDNITAYEQAVHVTEVNLANTRDTYNKTINNYKAQAITVIKSSLIKVNTALDNINTILKDEAVKETFSARDTSYLINTKQYYALAASLRLKADESLDQVQAQSAYDEIENVLDKTAQVAEETFNALKNIYSALENTVVSLSFSQTQLDAFKTTVSSHLTLVSAVKSEIQNIVQSLETANLNYINQVTLSEQNLAQAQANLDDAFLSAQNSLSTVELASQKQAILAQARLDSAEKALDLAKARLQQIKAPARSTDVALQKAHIAQAEAALESVLHNIKGSVINAPQDGKIIKVNYEVGEQNLNQPVISMLIDDSFKIEVDISETDIVKVEKGDKVEITLDAFGEDVKFGGNVSFIEPAETLIQDVVYYKVTIDFDTNSSLIQKIKPGMSANVTIITDKKENILIVPYRAIVSRNGGDELIRILSNNVLREVPLKTGMRGDGGNIEALQGVKQGDVVVTYVKQ